MWKHKFEVILSSDTAINLEALEELKCSIQETLQETQDCVGLQEGCKHPDCDRIKCDPLIVVGWMKSYWED